MRVMLNKDVLYILALICVTILLNQDESTQIILLKLAASVLFWGIYTNRTETRNIFFIIDDKYHIYMARIYRLCVFVVLVCYIFMVSDYQCLRYYIDFFSIYFCVYIHWKHILLY